jgi:hypothetical protein
LTKVERRMMGERIVVVAVERVGRHQDRSGARRRLSVRELLPGQAAGARAGQPPEPPRSRSVEASIVSPSPPPGSRRGRSCAVEAVHRDHVVDTNARRASISAEHTATLPTSMMRSRAKGRDH